MNDLDCRCIPCVQDWVRKETGYGVAEFYRRPCAITDGGEVIWIGEPHEAARHYVYLLVTHRGDIFYVGITDSPERRYRAHASRFGQPFHPSEDDDYVLPQAWSLVVVDWRVLRTAALTCERQWMYALGIRCKSGKWKRILNRGVGQAVVM